MDERIQAIVNTREIGVSFSLKTCQDYGIEWRDCLHSLITSGVRRYRLMSYWDLHEPSMGVIDLRLLDEQIDLLAANKCRISLCVGTRQPRWPETHLPSWAIGLPEMQREDLFMTYFETVVQRYRERPNLESWQLENEFWNKGYGKNNNFSRRRLVKEFDLLRHLSPDRPIIMSLANTYGVPFGQPKPDIFGTTLYRVQFEKGRYSRTKYWPGYFRMRRSLIRLMSRRDLIIHELQAEPWGPNANWEMSDEEQAKSMDAQKLSEILAFARKTGITYMDLWGGEWWYWRLLVRQDHSLQSMIEKSTSLA